MNFAEIIKAESVEIKRIAVKENVCMRVAAWEYDRRMYKRSWQNRKAWLRMGEGSR